MIFDSFPKDRDKTALSPGYLHTGRNTATLRGRSNGCWGILGANLSLFRATTGLETGCRYNLMEGQVAEWSFSRPRKFTDGAERRNLPRVHALQQKGTRGMANIVVHTVVYTRSCEAHYSLI